MASKNPQVRRAVINYANACKDPSDTERLAAAHADLATERVADFLVQTLAAAPPLSETQRGRLVRLLGGEGSS